MSTTPIKRAIEVETPNENGKYIRTLGAKVGNVFGVLLILGGLTNLFQPQPTDDISPFAYFALALFGLSLMDFHMPWLQRTFSPKKVDQVRVCIPIIVIVVSVVISYI